MEEQEDVLRGLRERLGELEQENRELRVNFPLDGADHVSPAQGEGGSKAELPPSTSSSLLDASSSSVLEQSLEEAEGRIAGLLQVKDRLVTVQVIGFHSIRILTS